MEILLIAFTVVTLGGLLIYGSTRIIGALISPLYEPQLEDMLRKTGQWEEFQAGKCLCVGCQTSVTVETLGLVIEAEDSPQFICKDSFCIMSYYDKLEGVEAYDGTSGNTISVSQSS